MYSGLVDKPETSTNLNLVSSKGTDIARLLSRAFTLIYLIKLEKITLKLQKVAEDVF
ncbi:MAG: hypothetical protein NTY50_14185 [Methylobacter sp.]|nr:hypothetical protein [Methylobacter sp.]